MSALCYDRTCEQQQIAASFNDLLGVLFFRGRNVVAGAGAALFLFVQTTGCVRVATFPQK
jgi:hypothetical protein